jgi:hypothetical protein
MPFVWKMARVLNETLFQLLVTIRSPLLADIPAQSAITASVWRMARELRRTWLKLQFITRGLPTSEI